MTFVYVTWRCRCKRSNSESPKSGLIDPCISQTLRVLEVALRVPVRLQLVYDAPLDHVINLK